MKRFLLLAALSIMAAVSCSKGPQSPFAHRVADYAVVTFDAPDLSGITDNGKEVLRLYRYAADVVDSIYWQQYFGDRQALLDGIEDPYQKTFAEINYGPWDRADGSSFVEGYGDRPAGAGFYPSDMTVAEFNAWDNPDKDSPYTLIRRAADGSLEDVWYHDAFKSYIDKIENALKVAADVTIKPSVRDQASCQKHGRNRDEPEHRARVHAECYRNPFGADAVEIGNDRPSK